MSVNPAIGVQVLVVDDDAASRHLAQLCLVSEGYAVRLAASGAEAIESFKAAPVDIIVLDVMMPGLDGFATCKEIRQLEHPRRTSILFLTSHGDALSQQQALDAGGDDFLTKPATRLELQNRVRSLLWVRGLQNEVQTGLELIRTQRNALFSLEAKKQELMQLVVHDLKNPLTSISLNAQAALRSGTSGTDMQEILSDIVVATGAMESMILNLLDISRGEEGQLVPQPQLIDAAELFEQVGRSIRPRLAAREQRLVIEMDTAPAPSMSADRELVTRLLGNLLDNSSRYAPMNGVIRLSAARQGAFLRLEVADDGPGVPDPYKEHVFEKYIQLAGAEPLRTSRGLGLVFCLLAAEAHGGRIWVEDKKPSGTAFCVLLPAA